MMTLTVILVFTNFLETLFIVIIAYYGFKIFRNIFFPSSGNYSSQHQRSRSTQNQRPEGDVRVEKNQYRSSRISKDEGEYVDFEEID